MMISKMLLLAGLMLIGTALAVESTTQPGEKRAAVRIALVGDSTVTNHAGWGAGFAARLHGDIECINFAASGRSSKSYINEGRWKRVLDAKPDYILIQFGHNDVPGKGEARETDPETTFTQYMTQYVKEARAIGAKPILCTSIERRNWINGKVEPTLKEYADAVRKLAADENVPLIDLNARTLELYNTLGEEKVNELSPRDSKDKSRIDGTHLNARGSEVIGKTAADELKQAAPELQQYIN